MKFRRLGCQALLLSLSICSLSNARPSESPWDCIRRVLQQLTPERPSLDEVVYQLQDLLRHRRDVVGVAESADQGFITIAVKTANEHRYIDGRFGPLGYRGWAVSPEVSLHRPGEWHLPPGDPRESELWTQMNLLEYLPEAVERMRRHQTVSFELVRPATPESKMDEALRAQLASDDYRLDSRWNPDRRVLLTLYPHQMHWHYLHATALGDGPVPTAQDIHAQLPTLIEAFKRRYAREVGMQVITERALRGGLAVRLMVTFPAQPGLMRVLRDENVLSAAPLEHFDLD